MTEIGTSNAGRASTIEEARRLAQERADLTTQPVTIYRRPTGGFLWRDVYDAEGRFLAPPMQLGPVPREWENVEVIHPSGKTPPPPAINLEAALEEARQQIASLQRAAAEKADEYAQALREAQSATASAQRASAEALEQAERADRLEVECRRWRERYEALDATLVDWIANVNGREGVLRSNAGRELRTILDGILDKN